MNDNIRVGLIGYGYASKTFHAPLIAGTQEWNWLRFQAAMRQKSMPTGHGSCGF
jgi:predicted dehydrogenase